MHVDSNHPPSVIKQIPLGINKRLASISSNNDVFARSVPDYQKALKESGYKHELKMPDTASTGPRNSNGSNRKKREVMYYTPPFNKDLKTKIGRIFLDLVRKHFPAHHKLHPILNKNTLKLSFLLVKATASYNW